MKLMVIGGGGREHAIIKALKKNPAAEVIYALPGNGGIAADATCVPIGAKDIPAIVDFAQENAIDFAVVAPDDLSHSVHLIFRRSSSSGTPVSSVGSTVLPLPGSV